MTESKKLSASYLPECSNCGSTDLNLRACTGCRAAQYCGVACQLQHWKAKDGHKLKCTRSLKPASVVPSPTKDTRVGRLCSICLEPLRSSGVVALSCAHLFHLGCIAQLPVVRDRQLCPDCRSIIPTIPTKPIATADLLYLEIVSQVKAGICSWDDLRGTERADMDVALSTWKTLATCDNCENAQFLLANAYFSGHGVASDPAQGFHWMRISAENGNNLAQMNLAIRYQNGDCLPMDLERSFYWFSRACETSDDPFAMFALGMCYRQGHGTKQDHRTATNWLRKSAEAGKKEAQYQYGRQLLLGNGTPPFPSAAVAWFWKSSTQGYFLAHCILGVLLVKGTGMPQNYAEAARLIKLASVRSCHGMYLLGVLYRRGVGVAQSKEEARRCFLKSAQAGHAAACFQLGCSYCLDDGSVEDVHEGNVWLRRAANGGYPFYDIVSIPGSIHEPDANVVSLDKLKARFLVEESWIYEDHWIFDSHHSFLEFQ